MEAEYGGADMSTANDGGSSGTPDGTRFDRRSVHRWTRTHVWAVTGQQVRVSMSDLILIGEKIENSEQSAYLSVCMNRHCVVVF